MLPQPGATDVVLLEGINDIASEDATAADVIGGMRQIITRVHARGLRIHGGTLTPHPRHAKRRSRRSSTIRTE